MKAGRGEEYVVRQHPEPVADIQGRKKSRETSCQIEIRKTIIKKLGQPDFSRCEPLGIACDFLRGAKVEMFWRGLRQHASSLLMVTVLMMIKLS